MAKRKQQSIPQTAPRVRMGVRVRVALPSGEHLVLDYPTAIGWGWQGGAQTFLAVIGPTDTMATFNTWISAEWILSE